MKKKINITLYKNTNINYEDVQWFTIEESFLVFQDKYGQKHYVSSAIGWHVTEKDIVH